MTTKGCLYQYWWRPDEVLNFSVTYHYFEEATYGYRLPNGSWGGIVVRLQENLYDIAVVDLSIKQSRKEIIDFTFPVAEQMWVLFITITQLETKYMSYIVASHDNNLNDSLLLRKMTTMWMIRYCYVTRPQFEWLDIVTTIRITRHCYNARQFELLDIVIIQQQFEWFNIVMSHDSNLNDSIWLRHTTTISITRHCCVIWQQFEWFAIVTRHDNNLNDSPLWRNRTNRLNGFLLLRCTKVNTIRQVQLTRVFLMLQERPLDRQEVPP